jgi:predicted nuclease of predicted toxin-antitoxin system
LKIKLDENLGPSVAEIFRGAGHDVSLTLEQGLGGHDDRVLIEVCRVEGRCLVTLDLDFSNILNFPPQRYPGIAVLRVPEPMSLSAVLDSARALLLGLEQRDIRQKLWVLQGSRIREYWADGE